MTSGRHGRNAILPPDSSDIVPLFGSPVVGFAFSLVVGYLALFGLPTLDSDLALVSGDVVIGYVTARLA